MLAATIQAIASYLPPRHLTNQELAQLYPQWSPEKIFDKTGILERTVVGENEYVSDLAVAAGRRVLERAGIAATDIDLVVLCTQSPDYALPTTACLVQDRLGIPTRAAAFDFNQGCSGYPYGLAIVRGLLESRVARHALLITAETYTRYIHPLDKSVRTLFGDAAAATLIGLQESDSPSLGPFVLGTDGSGAGNLIVPASAAHARPASEISERADDSGNVRSEANLFMDGPAIFEFTLKRVPTLIAEVMAAANLGPDDVRYFVLHQANEYMLRFLQRKMKIPDERFPVHFSHSGNTVSSTIPIVLEQLAMDGRLDRGDVIVVAGFGVGYSWGANVIRWNTG